MKVSFADMALPTSGAVVFLVEEGKALSGLTAEADSKCVGALAKACTISRFTGASGQTLEIF